MSDTTFANVVYKETFYRYGEKFRKISPNYALVLWAEMTEKIGNEMFFNQDDDVTLGS